MYRTLKKSNEITSYSIKLKVPRRYHQENAATGQKCPSANGRNRKKCIESTMMEIRLTKTRHASLFHSAGMTCTPSLPQAMFRAFQKILLSISPPTHHPWLSCPRLKRRCAQTKKLRNSSRERQRGELTKYKRLSETPRKTRVPTLFHPKPRPHLSTQVFVSTSSQLYSSNVFRQRNQCARRSAE